MFCNMVGVQDAGHFSGRFAGPTLVWYPAFLRPPTRTLDFENNMRIVRKIFKRTPQVDPYNPPCTPGDSNEPLLSCYERLNVPNNIHQVSRACLRSTKQ